MDTNTDPWEDIYSLEEFQATINADTASGSTAGNGILTGVTSTAENRGLPTIASFIGTGMASNQNLPRCQAVHSVPITQGIPNVGMAQGAHNVPITPGTHNVPIMRGTHNAPMPQRFHNAPIAPGIHDVLLGNSSPTVAQPIHNTPIGLNAPMSHHSPISAGSSQPEELMDFIITRNDVDEPAAEVNHPPIVAPGLGHDTYFPPFPESPAVEQPSSPVLQPTPAPSGNAVPLQKDFVSKDALDKHASSHTSEGLLPENDVAFETSSSFTEGVSNVEQCHGLKTDDTETVKHSKCDRGADTQKEVIGYGRNVLNEKSTVDPVSPGKQVLMDTVLDKEASVIVCATEESIDDTAIVDTAKNAVEEGTEMDLGQIEKDSGQTDTVEKDTEISTEHTDTVIDDGQIKQNTAEKDTEHHNGTEMVGVSDSAKQNGTEEHSEAIENINEDTQICDSNQGDLNTETHVTSDKTSTQENLTIASKESGITCEGSTGAVDSHSSTFSNPSDSNHENMESNSIVSDATRSEDTTKSAFSCKVCGAMCQDVHALRDHMDHDHCDPKPYDCILCDFSFDDLQLLKTHLFTAHDATLCFGCGVEMMKSDLKTHLQVCTFPMLPSFVEKFKEILQDELNESKSASNEQHSENRWKDKALSETSKSRRLKILKSKKVLKCNLGRQSLKSSGPRTKHDAIRRPIFQCHGCRKRFSKKEALLRHQKHSHEDSDSPVMKCETCDKTFRTQRNLLLHKALVHQSNKQYQCSICEKSFRKRWRLQDHVQSHFTEQQPQPLNCNICGETFETSANLQAHLVLHYTQGLYSCAVCHIQFDNQWRFETHLRSHHQHVAGGNNGDSVSPQEPTITSMPIAHQEIKSEPIDYAYGDLEDNNVAFPAQDNMQPNFGLQIGEAFSLMEPSAPSQFAGYRIVKPVGSVQIGYPSQDASRFVCDDCEEEYPTEYDLMLHKAKYHEEEFGRDFECTVCQKTFATKSQFYGHIGKHRSANTCGDCGAFYKYYGAHLKICPGKKKKAKKQKLKVALSKEVHKKARIRKDTEPDEPDEEKLKEKQEETKLLDTLYECATRFGDKLRCPSCSKVHRPEYLKEHLKVHISEKELYCPSCGKFYKNPESYDKHLEYCQEKQARYSCNDCTQTFWLKSLWQAHRLDHYRSNATYIKLPTFECCQNTFPHIAGLYLHQKQSHGKKWIKVQCRLCQEYLVGLDAYLSHVEANPSDEQFECPCCLKCFHSLDTLEKHMTETHSNEAEPCPVCQKSLLAWDLPKHRKNEHGPDTWVDKNVSSQTPSTSTRMPYSRSGKPKKTLQYQCRICRKQFSSYYYIRQHALAAHKEQVEKDLISSRMQNFGTSTPVTEEDVLRSIAKRKMLVVIDPVKPDSCQHCRQTFKSAQGLKEHEESGCERKSLTNKDEDLGKPEEHQAGGDDEFVADGLLLGGYKSVTVSGPTKFWCEKCQVYCRSVYYFAKHEVIHEKNIDVMQYTDIIERRRNIEQIVAELAPPKQREPKITKKKRRSSFASHKKRSNRNSLNAKQATENSKHPDSEVDSRRVSIADSNSSNVKDSDPHDHITDQTNAEDKPPEETESDKTLPKTSDRPTRVVRKTVEKDQSSVQENFGTEWKPATPVCAGYKAMTVADISKFWCGRCKVYFRNAYYLAKHEVIHQRNIDIDTDTDITERRQHIERLVSELTPGRRKDIPVLQHVIRTPEKVAKTDQTLQNEKDHVEGEGVPEAAEASGSPNIDLINQESDLNVSQDGDSATDSSFVRAGFKYMTVDEETKFRCDRCQVFFRNAYYLDKHLIIHRHYIDIDISRSMLERRQEIEELVAKLLPPRKKESPIKSKLKIQKSMKKRRLGMIGPKSKKHNRPNETPIKMSSNKTLDENTNKSDNGWTPGEDVNEDQANLPLLTQITCQDQIFTKQKIKPQTQIASPDPLEASHQSPEPTKISIRDLSTFKPMTTETRTKFWCESCQVYFKNEYFNKKHMVIHECNVEFGHIDDVTERRKQIEQCIRKLTLKPRIVQPKERSPKSLKVDYRTKFQCPTCQEYYRNYYFLKLHMKDNHETSEKIADESSAMKRNDSIPETSSGASNSEVPEASYMADNDHVGDESIKVKIDTKAEEMRLVLGGSKRSPEPCFLAKEEPCFLESEDSLPDGE